MENRPGASLSDINKLHNDRLLFELYLQQQNKVDTAARLLEQEQLYDQLIQDLPDQYSWIQTASEEQRNILLNAFNEIHTFAHQGKAVKTGREVYVHFRRRIETNEQASDHDIIAVHLVEALLKGDLKNGVLPINS